MDAPQEELVTSIYDAALDRSKWPAALERIRVFTATTAIQLMAVDRRLGVISFSATANAPHEAELAYVRHYCAIDPRVKILLADEPGAWMYCHEHLSDEFVSRDPFHQELMLPIGLRYVAGCKVYEDENTTVVLALFQGVGLPPVSRLQTSRADLLTPHLHRAIRLSISNFIFSAQALVGVEIVNRLRYPVFLLSREGNVVHMNGAARVVMEEGDSLLRMDGSRLSCVDAGAAKRITSALNSLQTEGAVTTSIAGRQSGPPPSQILSLERPGRRPLKGFVTSLQPQAVMGVFGPQRLMMAAFSDPGKSALPDASFLMAAYGLTPAEARVATQVALGKSIKQTAQELQVQPTTVRTQLDNVFRKTGTAKQAEMVAELLSLPDMRVEGMGRVGVH